MYRIHCKRKGNTFMKHLLLHGLGQTSSSWDKVISSTEWQPDCDCPNLFDLLKGKEINYSNLYGAFSDYCRSFNEPFGICGLSLGGMLALNYAACNPENLKYLVLIGTQHSIPKNLMKFQNLIFRFLPGNTFAKMGLTKNEVIGLTNSMTELNFKNDLSRINCPALIVCGEKDRANLNASFQLKEMISGAKLEIMRGAGHEINTEMPLELQNVLDKFLKTCS